MTAVVIAHVNVNDLPEHWRARLQVRDDSLVTVRIELESEPACERISESAASTDPAFGIWRDRDDIADVDEYLCRLRAARSYF